MPVILLIVFLFCLFGGLYKTAIVFGLLILIPAAYHLRNSIKTMKFLKEIKNMPSEKRSRYEEIFAATDKQFKEEAQRKSHANASYYGGFKSYYN